MRQLTQLLAELPPHTAKIIARSTKNGEVRTARFEPRKEITHDYQRKGHRP